MTLVIGIISFLLFVMLVIGGFIQVKQVPENPVDVVELRYNKINSIKDIYLNPEQTLAYSFTTVYPMVISAKSIYPKEIVIKAGEAIKLIMKVDAECRFSIGGYDIVKSFNKNSFYELEFKSVLSDSYDLSCRLDNGRTVKAKLFFAN